MASKSPSKKAVKITEIKSKIKVFEPKSKDVSELEDELEEAPVIQLPTTSSVPIIRPTIQSQAPVSGRTPEQSPKKEGGEERETGYSQTSDNARYTALANQDNVTRYVMHSGAKADERVAVSRPRESAPVLGARQSGFIGQGERFVGQPMQSNEGFSALRQDSLQEDRRYDLYKESDGLHDAQKPRSRRR